MTGVLVNAAAILCGSLIGLLFGKIKSEKLGDAVMTGLALCVMYIGISGAVKSGSEITGNIEPYYVLIVIFSIVCGTVIGTLLGIDEHLEALGAKIENKLGRGEGFAKSFVSSTLLFCVGAMAIVGSLDAGLTGDNSTLFAKSILDGISSIIFAGALGFGVIFSIVPLILYQGGIALLAGVIAPVLSQNTIMGMKLVGSLLIVALSLNMLGATKIKVANLMPAVFLPIGLVPLCEFIIKLF